ncbi:hypothetical protein D9M71_306330 [compost metagenome]
MQGGLVIPVDDVADLPRVGVEEARLADVLAQPGDQRLAALRVVAGDFHFRVHAEVEQALAALRMDPHQRVLGALDRLDVRRAIGNPGAAVAALADADERVVVDQPQAVDLAAGFLVEGLVGQRQVVPAGFAALRRHFQGVEQRAGGGQRRPLVVAVRRQREVAQLAFVVVGNADDVRRLAVGTGRQHRHVGRRLEHAAEPGGEVEELAVVESLATEHQDVVVAQGLLEGEDLPGRQRLAGIEAADAGAERRVQRGDGEGFRLRKERGGGLAHGLVLIELDGREAGETALTPALSRRERGKSAQPLRTVRLNWPSMATGTSPARVTRRTTRGWVP